MVVFFRLAGLNFSFSKSFVARMVPARAFHFYNVAFNKLHTVCVNLAVLASFRYWNLILVSLSLFRSLVMCFLFSCLFLLFLNKVTELCSCIENIVHCWFVEMFLLSSVCFLSFFLPFFSCCIYRDALCSKYATICSVFMEKLLHNCIILQIVWLACNKRIVLLLALHQICAALLTPQPIFNFIEF